MNSKFWETIIKDKRFQLKKGYPSFNIGTISVICVCIILLIIATFTKIPLFAINLFSPYDAFRGEETSFFSYFSYIPQVPTVFFIAALLGPRSGMIAVFLYVMAGLVGLPVFSSGGGISYFLKPGMGYLLGFFPAIFFVSNILRKKEWKFRIIIAAIAGIICVHLIGILYLTMLMFFQGEQLFLILSWFWLLTGMQLFYDLIFGIIAILFARFSRQALSIITD